MASLDIHTRSRHARHLRLPRRRLRGARPPLAQRLRLLKWISIIVPAVTVFALEMVRHQVVEPFIYRNDLARTRLAYSVDLGNLIVGLFAFGLAFAFGQIVFGVIERMQAKLLRRNAELAALNQVAASAALSLDVDEVVQHCCATLSEIFEADEVRIEPATAGSDRGGLIQSGGRVEARVPLQCGGHPLGMLLVARDDRAHPRTFSRSERRLLRAVADTLGIALENARLHQQVHEAAIVEERNRIAREMHDGVAQVLAFVLMKLGTVDDLAAGGAVPEARRELEKLRQEAERAYTDVREEIVGLRVATAVDADLAELLHAYLADFEDHTDIQTEVDVDALRDLALPREHELQIVRVVQEALTNVRKHARAHRVCVAARHESATVVVEVRDDGRGMRPERVGARPGRRFGLLSMRERCESLDGTFAIESAPDKGTRVRIRIPFDPLIHHRRRMTAHDDIEASPAALR